MSGGEGERTYYRNKKFGALENTNLSTWVQSILLPSTRLSFCIFPVSLSDACSGVRTECQNRLLDGTKKYSHCGPVQETVSEMIT